MRGGTYLGREGHGARDGLRVDMLLHRVDQFQAGHPRGHICPKLLVSVRTVKASRVEDCVRVRVRVRVCVRVRMRVRLRV